MSVVKEQYWSVECSIAYSTVAAYARHPQMHPRPNAHALRNAEIHAKQLGDVWLLSRIAEIRSENERIDGTPTPKRPASTQTAEAIAEHDYSQDPPIEIAPPVHEDRFSGVHYSIVGDPEIDTEIDSLLEGLKTPKI